MPEQSFSQEEIARYSRHLLLPELGMDGQQKLKHGRVLVIGAGGLGCPALLYLAAAGVGTIGIVDDDVVDETNLHRQVLFTTQDIGKPKAAMAAAHLTARNPHIHIDVFNTRLTSKNALKTMKGYDLVVDGTDNFATRYLINDACVLQKKPNIHGAIYRFEGQVSVFNYQYEDGSAGPNYRDLFPEPPAPELAPNCATTGVLGVLPGLIGTLQASETIKILTGIGEPLAGKLLFIDALTLENRMLTIPANPDKPTIQLLHDYDAFCSTPPPPPAVQEITVSELHQQLREAKQHIQIIDVREDAEFRAGNIGGASVPLGKITKHHLDIPQSDLVVVVCRSGQRSAKAMEKLQLLGYKNLVNLQGGLLEWARQIDSSITVI